MATFSEFSSRSSYVFPPFALDFCCFLMLSSRVYARIFRIQNDEMHAKLQRKQGKIGSWKWLWLDHTLWVVPIWSLPHPIFRSDFSFSKHPPSPFHFFFTSSFTDSIQLPVRSQRKSPIRRIRAKRTNNNERPPVSTCYFPHLFITSFHFHGYIPHPISREFSVCLVLNILRFKTCLTLQSLQNFNIQHHPLYPGNTRSLDRIRSLHVIILKMNALPSVSKAHSSIHLPITRSDYGITFKL